MTVAGATLRDINTWDALKAVFTQYMPGWGPTGRSYATTIHGGEASALLHMVDTPELFGGELRILGAIDFVDGVGPLKYAVRLGQRWPLHATGGGKLYLAQYDDATVREMLAETGLEPVTPETIVDLDALIAELAEVRRNGWARQREEIHEGISGFAAPVRDATGRLLAALVVMGPTARIDAHAEAIVASLVSEAQALSVEAGGLDPAAAGADDLDVA